MTPGPFKARLFPRSPDRWHRVEREGAHETEQPVALAKEPEDAIAFAALHDLAEALRPFAEQGVSDDDPCHRGLVAKEACARCGPILAARKALLAMKGERR